MSGIQIVKTLTTKYAKLLGEYEFAERMVEDAFGMDAIAAATERCDRRKKEINEKLAAIETVIELFDPDWDPAKVKATRPRTKHLKSGAISRAAYGILRDAKIPMTSREVARVVAARLGYGKLEERDMARIDSAIFNALKGRVGTTLQIVNQNPTRWALIPRDQVRPRTKAHPHSHDAAPEEIEVPLPPAIRLRASQ